MNKAGIFSLVIALGAGAPVALAQVEGAVQYPPASAGIDAQPPAPARMVPLPAAPNRMELGIGGSSTAPRTGNFRHYPAYPDGGVAPLGPLPGSAGGG